MKRFLIPALIILSVITSALYAVPGGVIISYPTPGTCPTGLTYDGKYLWLADRLSDTLYAINPDNGAVEKMLPAPGFIPRGLAWDGKYLWCIDAEENRIYQMDLKSGITLKSIEIPVSKPQGLTWDGEKLWLSDESSDIITSLSIEDGTIISSFKAPATSPQGLTFDGKYLWCADRMRDRIYMIETENGEVLLSIDAPGKHARGLAWIKGNLWNVDYESDMLYKLTVRDEIQLKATDPKIEKLVFTQEYRNYGPGEVVTYDAFIAVPHDRPSQKLLGDIEWNTPPTEFVEDRWGQKFARFSFNNADLTVRNRAVMTVSAKLYDTRWFVFPENVGKMDDIPKKIREKYTVDEDKYRINDPIIQNAVKECVGDEKNPYRIMRKVYKYVRDNLYYELAGGWNVAPAILERGNGSCSEFSFVFISICRAAGLPTKYVGSVAVRGDDASTDDVFHRWCECYLPGYGWVPIDPSGGDRDLPADVAEYFGHVANRYLITTEGGGASEYIGWGYNSDQKWTAKGPVKVHVEHVGEWSPVSEEE